MRKPANQFFPPEIEALQAVARTILDDFGGKVPSRMEELLTVPEVWRQNCQCAARAWLRPTWASG